VDTELPAPGHGPTHLVYGLNLLNNGRIEDARVHILRALDLDPKDPKVLRVAGMLYLVEGNYQAAIEQYEQYEQVPGDIESVFQLAYAHHLAGNEVRAAAKLLELWPSFALRLVGWSVFAQDGYTGLLLAGLDSLIQESGEPCTNAPADAALTLAIIGEADRMFECLGEIAPSKTFLSSNGITGHPGFNRYRDDPRFIAALKRLRPES
jgi:tetratricopeptide (TPR) repeat protein